MKIEGTKYSVAPKDNPLIYPGNIPNFSYLYEGEDFYELELSINRRVGQAYILGTGSSEAIKRESLNNSLVRKGATSLEFRYPVVAYGSNASPSQLERKYQQYGISSIIPVIQGSLSGIDIVYSPHITSYGAIPATAIVHKKSTSDIHVSFVNELQLQILDQTEPNYNRVRVESKNYPLQLKNGETLSEYYIYISKHGYLKFDDQTYRLSTIKTANSNFSPATQEEVLNTLIKYWNLDNQEMMFNSADDFVNQIRENKSLRDEMNRWISSSFKHSDNIISTDMESPPIVYRKIKPIWSDKKSDDYIVLPNYGRPPGDFALAINHESAKERDLGSNVRIEHTLHDHTFSVIAKRVENKSLTDRDSVMMDQILRDSLGIGVGDTVKIQKLEKEKRTFRRWLLDLFIPRNYMIMRVQSADILMVEKPNCSMDEIAMDILAVQEGDVVIFESSVYDPEGKKYEHKALPIRAYRTPESTKSLREATQSGTFLNTRFPNCSEVFGVFPDIPWVFIDADARNALGVRPCSPVKVRASRWYQITKEFRNFSLLIIVALLGATSLLETEPVKLGERLQIPSNLCILFPGILLIAWLVFSSLKQRLSPKIKQ